MIKKTLIPKPYKSTIKPPYAKDKLPPPYKCKDLQLAQQNIQLTAEVCEHLKKTHLKEIQQYVRDNWRKYYAQDYKNNQQIFDSWVGADIAFMSAQLTRKLESILRHGDCVKKRESKSRREVIDGFLKMMTELKENAP